MARKIAERFLYPPGGPLFPMKGGPLRPVRVMLMDAPPIERLREQFGAEINVTVKWADAMAAIDLEDEWHHDGKSGYRWNPTLFFSEIRAGAEPGADVKTPWDLSRCHHFVAFAQAYALTKDEKYAAAFFSQVQSWIRANPPKRGVNWVCAMDVALRACNWLAAWDIFRSSPSAPAGFQGLFSASLREHGKHVFDHREWGAGVSTNHYLSNLLGLFYVGLALDEPRWVDFAQKEFSVELFRQTYDDGFDYEGSTAYHRFTLEIFFFYSLVCDRNPERAKPLGAVFLERLELMCETLRRLSANDGTMPFIGDNDSGRVHVLLKRDDADVSAVPPTRSNTYESLWLPAFKPVERPIGPKGLSQSGLMTLRGANDLLVFCASPNGTGGVGNHTHNDKLSFCLWVEGEWFFIDPGTGVYTSDPEMRDQLRSTRAHNTAMIDGNEQNRFVPGSMFSLMDDARISDVQWERSGVVEATLRSHRPVVHRRRIERRDGPLRWEIVDAFLGADRTRIEWFFHLAPGIRAERSAEGWVFTGKKNSLLLVAPSPLSPGVLVEGPYSPKYGEVKTAPVVTFSAKIELPCQVSFRIAARGQV